MLEIKKEQLDAVVKAIEKHSVKEAKGEGKFKVIGSAEVVDRDGDIIIQDGIETERYMKNPIVLWAHNYSALPIGRTEKLYIDIIDGKTVTVFEGEFATADANPEAQKVRKLYDMGMVNTTSIGFITKERDADNFDKISRCELLEISFVPVPANQEAVDIMKSKGIYDCYKGLCKMSNNDNMKSEIDNDDKVTVENQIVGLKQEIADVQGEVEDLKKAVIKKETKSETLDLKIKL